MVWRCLSDDGRDTTDAVMMVRALAEELQPRVDGQLHAQEVINVCLHSDRPGLAKNPDNSAVLVKFADQAGDDHLPVFTAVEETEGEAAAAGALTKLPSDSTLRLQLTEREWGGQRFHRGQRKLTTSRAVSGTVELTALGQELAKDAEGQGVAWINTFIASPGNRHNILLAKPDSNSLAKPYPTHRLRLKIHCVTDIEEAESGRRDPYLVMGILNGSGQISEIKETSKVVCQTDPTFNEAFEWDINEDEMMGGASVQIELMDWDRFWEDRKLGFVNVPLGDLRLGKPLRGSPCFVGPDGQELATKLYVQIMYAAAEESDERLVQVCSRAIRTIYTTTTTLHSRLSCTYNVTNHSS
jgi:hypothetical protein